jgi:hypothetical protein
MAGPAQRAQEDFPKAQHCPDAGGHVRGDGKVRRRAGNLRREWTGRGFHAARGVLPHPGMSNVVLGSLINSLFLTPLIFSHQTQEIFVFVCFPKLIQKSGKESYFAQIVPKLIDNSRTAGKES